MAPSARHAARLGGFAVALALLLLLRPGVLAVEYLQNGGFESGATRWTPNLGFTTTSCAPRSGSGVGVLTQMAQNAPFVRQNLTGPLSAGLHTFSGYLRVESGSPAVRVTLIWSGATGSNPLPEPLDVAVGADWSQFSLSRTPPAFAERVSVEVRITGANDGVVCLDDLSVDAPPLPTATPTVESTAISSPLPASPTPTNPPPTATAPATSASPASATPRPATATSSAVPGPSFVFSNGGFESGTAGWQKFGGELTAVSSPRNGGSGAGRLESSSTSTKWAFQPVRIEPGQLYEFRGYLQAGAGVAQAYLRISWYAAADASGQALATDDSTQSVYGPSGGFSLLTTGPRAAPAGAHSARLRAVLVPAGGSAGAFLYLDDFSFGTATAPAGVTPVPAATPAADEPFEAPAVAAPPRQAASPAATRPTQSGAATRAAGTSTRAAGGGPSATAGFEVAAVAARDTVVAATPSGPLDRLAPDELSGDGGDGVWQIVAVAAILFAASLTGAYFLARPRGGREG